MEGKKLSHDTMACYFDENATPGVDNLHEAA